MNSLSKRTLYVGERNEDSYYLHVWINPGTDHSISVTARLDETQLRELGKNINNLIEKADEIAAAELIREEAAA